MEGLQNRKKGTERVQAKLGKTHVDYWYSKLRKRNFSGRDGLQVQVPDWQVRLTHLGRSMWFNLKTANAAEAAVKARDIYIYLIANGWEAVLEKFKPRTEKLENLTVGEFVDLYREKIELVEYPPIIRTVERYVGCLLLICKLVGIKRIAQLTEEKVATFKQKYLKRGRDKKRDETSVKLTCNSHLRGAAALFAKQMMKAYETAGFEVVNPFEGQLLRRIELKPYTPIPRELLDSIWGDSAKLRDGDPEAPAPSKPLAKKKPKQRQKKRPNQAGEHQFPRRSWRALTGLQSCPMQR